MTGFQAKQIRELRVRGGGYRSIASVVGLSRDIVRNYCKTHDLDGLATNVRINIKEKMENKEACLSCGRDLKQPVTGRKRKFCSETCRREWWLQHSDSIKRNETSYYELTCAYCEEGFKVYGNKNRKYCSHNCYVHDRF